MRLLLLGGYGFIGLEAARALIARGHAVTAVGRDIAHGRRVLPNAQWLAADIAQRATPESWTPLLDGIDGVVNASGALQDGLRDNVTAVQDTAIRALVAACETAGVKRFVQVSAPGVSADATTGFLRSKAAGDAALAASTLDWVILRPGLVWGRTATGGTALVRMLAAFPVFQPLMLADARVQTVDIDDVCAAIVAAVEGKLPGGTDIDLVEAAPLTLGDIVAQVRAWHGFPPPRTTLHAPRVLGALAARLGDAAGWLGWRTPLRTTSLRALERGVIGDPAPWRLLNGAHVARFAEALARRPVTKQDRLFARLQLLLPLMIITLSGFWIASGLIGIAQRDAAAAVLSGRLDNPVAFVIAGSLADIAIGLALLWRPWARLACFGMIALTAIYLIAGTLITPALWLDPLGAFVKTLPAALLALACAAMLEER
ncbi:MAG: SDR family oxidoreductase [Hyphomonadaceae bacterium]|nr:SDR family oxidoreductase [Hyphomonadaceae bacterium]